MAHWSGLLLNGVWPCPCACCACTTVNSSCLCVSRCGVYDSTLDWDSMSATSSFIGDDTSKQSVVFACLPSKHTVAIAAEGGAWMTFTDGIITATLPTDGVVQSIRLGPCIRSRPTSVITTSSAVIVLDAITLRPLYSECVPCSQEETDNRSLCPQGLLAKGCRTLEMCAWVLPPVSSSPVRVYAAIIPSRKCFLTLLGFDSPSLLRMMLSASALRAPAHLVSHSLLMPSEGSPTALVFKYQFLEEKMLQLPLMAETPSRSSPLCSSPYCKQ